MKNYIASVILYRFKARACINISQKTLMCPVSRTPGLNLNPYHIRNLQVYLCTALLYGDISTYIVDLRSVFCCFIGQLQNWSAKNSPHYACTCTMDSVGVT